ncbi:hypothetical protein F2Q69_00028477 [Brassica cretica]|uniref:Uncharacterized protein n=1 Tax=Brassica cretica TaxID=69181 RepID=A0A8S9S5V3_BRACR|nr:hypothetical protein F2Q69_00028477 [Brassica cretica]
MDVSAPEIEIQRSGSSTTPVRVVDTEPAHESMPPPSAKREIVLMLPTPSGLRLLRRRVARGRALTRTRPREREAPKLVLCLPRRLVRFVSLIDGMISEFGSEVELLAKELEESREKLSQLEGKLKVIVDAHSLEEARFESWIGELEQDLGKTTSSLLKAKEAKASKSLELRRLKHKVKSGEGSSDCTIGEAKEVMCIEFQTRLARIPDSLNSLAAIHIRDLAFARVEGGTNEVGEAPLSPRAEGAMLSIRRAELGPVAEDGGGNAAPIPEGATGEGEAPRTEDD